MSVPPHNTRKFTWHEGDLKLPASVGEVVDVSPLTDDEFDELEAELAEIYGVDNDVPDDE